VNFKKHSPFFLNAKILEGISVGKLKRSQIGRRDDGYGNLRDFAKSFDSSKFLIFYFLIFITVFIFFIRLFALTIVGGEKNRNLADENRIRLLDIEPERGKIFDRNGQLLAASQKIFLLKKDLQVSEISEKTAGELEKQLLAGENFEGELGKIEQKIKREYKFGEILAHVLGFVSQLQAEDQRSAADSSGQIGRLGIEAAYDSFLKGKTGKKLIEVDTKGKNISVLGEDADEIGRSLHLTIDSNLQKVVYNSLQKHLSRSSSKKGAVIIQNPNSGEVLALVSAPSFDQGNIAASLDDKNQPFLNRVTQGVYPPGSVFKIVSALAGLESGAITNQTEIEDVGEFYLGNVRFANWYYLTYGGKDGFVKIDKAIARSNDIFFYRLAEKTGLGAIRQMAIKLGMGQKTGIDLPDESFGLLPDETWKKSTQNSQWFLGDTLHLSIGQGFLQLTPLQINSVTSYMAVGYLTRPHLVFKIDAKDKKDEVEIKTKILANNIVKEENFKTVREGMKKACEEGGTGWPFFTASYKVGCKTGTAEKALGNPHALFTAFAPFENPKISITVVIEDGGEGSSVAAPVAREILDWYFGKK